MSLRPALNYHFSKIQAMGLLACGRSQAALQRFDYMLKLRPRDAYALASRAHGLARQNDFSAAIISLQELVDAWPQAAAHWFNLAFVLQQAGRHDEAGLAFRSAVACDPRMDRAWYGLALVLIHQRQFHAAVAALEKNTALQPLSPYGWYRLVQVRLALGQPDAALQLITHLRRFEPQLADQLARETGLGLPAERQAPATLIPTHDAAH
ncbi:tetratricopeptide repeat protein [Polaromonas sp. SM01]|uniref:tetratricopeptide repeat protein n=1 Tax=Polaromonas sp. SM01 TaxID=3085630 RepID=UPI0029821280|nr:tetratricopeptide repeat protein [Polaromonas sp. SM01]MDW5441920.1 tetratricopeptide repeat protein [Polaromonas sp. SM01]